MTVFTGVSLSCQVIVMYKVCSPGFREFRIRGLVIALELTDAHRDVRPACQAGKNLFSRTPSVTNHWHSAS